MVLHENEGELVFMRSRGKESKNCEDLEKGVRRIGKKRKVHFDIPLHPSHVKSVCILRE